MLFLFRLLLMFPVFYTVGCLAYQVDIQLRTYENKRNDDDGFFINVNNVFNTTSRIKNFSSGGSLFSILNRDYTVDILTTTGDFPGVNDTITIPSLDRIHGMLWSIDTIYPSYDFNIYTSADLTWIEATRSGSVAAPVLSTVYFLGPSAEIVNYYLSHKISNVKYFNVSDLKKHINSNYASIYNPRSIGAIEIPKNGLAGLNNSFSFNHLL